MGREDNLPYKSEQVKMILGVPVPQSFDSSYFYNNQVIK